MGDVSNTEAGMALKGYLRLRLAIWAVGGDVLDHRVVMGRRPASRDADMEPAGGPVRGTRAFMPKPPGLALSSWIEVR